MKAFGSLSSSFSAMADVAGSAVSVAGSVAGSAAGGAASLAGSAAGAAVSVAGSAVSGVGQVAMAPFSKPLDPSMKRATIRISMGDNMNDGMLGNARIVIIGDGKEIAEGPRAPARSQGDDDGYDLGYRLWKFGSTVSATIDDLPKNVNPTVILLYNDSTNGNWYVSKVEIETDAYTADGSGDNGQKKKFVFPCFSFVPHSKGGRVIFEGSSRLPWQTPPTLSALYRDAALEKQLEVYRFEDYTDLSTPPNLVDRGHHNYRPRLRPYPKRQATTISGQEVGIPVDDDFDFSKSYEFLGEAIKAQARAVIAEPAVFATNTQWKTVKGLINGLFGGLLGLRKPAVLKNGIDWKSDKEFGRQALAGVNPMEITSVDALPEGFSLSDADLGDDVLPEGLTLASALEAKRVFIMDYSLLEPLRPAVNQPAAKPGQPLRYLYAPRCLLFVEDDEDVIPIAVQLEKGGKVYTRAKDTSVGRWQWTLAKAYVASADSAVHQVGRHFLQCHAVCEVYLIALRRRVSEWHPLFKLLIPHFRFTMSINYKARSRLINAGGIIESVFTPGSKCMPASAELFKLWRFNEQALPEDLERRGVADRRVLPYYPYRDAGMLVWNAIHKYALTYLKIYYGEGDSAKDAIAKDRELQEFWTDVKYGNSKGEFSSLEEVGEGWPAMETVEDLAFVCATMIWTGSAQHAAINFSQYDYSAFSPNHPSCTRKPMPAQVDERAFLDVMPLPKDQITVLTVVDLLSSFSDDEEYIGRMDQTAYGWLVDPEARLAYKHFSNDLDDAREAIERMNEENKHKGRVPYIYLFPHNPKSNDIKGIPNSVAI